jgi:hypothetical protein
MDQKNYIESIKSFRQIKSVREKIPSDALLQEISPADKFVIFQLDYGQMMHISPKVYFDFRQKTMTEIDKSEVKSDKENQKPCIEVPLII